jgi:dsDNA-specific endonuclease/ATPase MutS2
MHGGNKMVKRISATRAVRDFSEVLNTIKFQGVHYIIERGGKPIASMKSIEEKIDSITLGELKNLLKRLPRLENELDAFASDLEEISRNQPLMSTGDLWE